MSVTLDLISETGETGGEGVAASSGASPLVFASFISTSAMVDSWLQESPVNYAKTHDASLSDAIVGGI